MGYMYTQIDEEKEEGMKEGSETFSESGNRGQNCRAVYLRLTACHKLTNAGNAIVPVNKRFRGKFYRLMVKPLPIY